jgi:tRNA A37 threonylcarbamoyladenosine dehydratase
MGDATGLKPATTETASANVTVHHARARKTDANLKKDLVKVKQGKREIYDKEYSEEPSVQVVVDDIKVAAAEEAHLVRAAFSSSLSILYSS